MALWVDGDFLTPTNLNTKGTGSAGMTDRTVNAADYSGATKEAKIAAAIAGALALGYSFVFVPGSMLPYDASLVTFNPAIHMIREGGNPNQFVYDIRAYGAAVNASTDDWAAIQAVLNDAASQSASGGNRPQTIEWGMGSARCSKPLWVKSPVRILGMRCGFNSNLAYSKLEAVPGFVGGPQLAIQSASAVVNGLTTPLVGTGNGWSATSNLRWLTLRNYTSNLDLNGLAGFCVELYYQGTASALNVFVSSAGRYAVGDTRANCFSLWLNGGNFEGILTTSSSGTVAATGTNNVGDGVLHELVLDYDGSTLRIFRDGVVQASTAATGTLVQSFVEDVTVGVGIDRAPDQLALYGHPNGTIDSIRISNVSRHTTNYTSVYAKRTSDAHTLALLNFDEQIGAFTKMVNKNGTAWAWEKDSTSAFGVPGFEIDGMKFYGSGGDCTAIHFAYAGQYEWSAEHIEIGAARCGIIALDGYDNYVRRYFLNGGTGGRYGLLFGITGGIGTREDGWTQGFGVHIFEGGSARYSRNFFQLDPFTHIGMIVAPQTSSNFPMECTHFQFNTEVGITAALFRANLLMAGNHSLPVQGLNLMSSVFESTPSSSAPLLLVDNADIVKLTCCSFNVLGSSTPASIVKVTGTLTQPVMFSQCGQIGTWTPWADVAGAAVVDVIGKGPAITFSATPTFSADARNTFEITLTGNVTSSTLQYHTPSQRLGWRIIQSGGPWTFAWPTNVKGGGTVGTGSNVQEFEVGLDGNAYAVAPMVTGM